MNTLSDLPKIIKRKKKRLGQGLGSGKGKTSGRGHKGQKAKGKIPITRSLGGIALVRRLPLYRGKYRNKPKGNKPMIINLKHLSLLSKNTVVDLKSIVSHGIIKNEDAERSGVKILGGGTVTVPLIIDLPCSKSAEKKIIKAGGKVNHPGKSQDKS